MTAKFGQPGFGCNSVLDTLPCQTVQGIMPFARTQPPASQSRVQGRDLELRNKNLITGPAEQILVSDLYGVRTGDF